MTTHNESNLVSDEPAVDMLIYTAVKGDIEACTNYAEQINAFNYNVPADEGVRDLLKYINQNAAYVYAQMHARPGYMPDLSGVPYFYLDMARNRIEVGMGNHPEYIVAQKCNQMATTMFEFAETHCGHGDYPDHDTLEKCAEKLTLHWCEFLDKEGTIELYNKNLEDICSITDQWFAVADNGDIIVQSKRTIH